MTEAVTETPSKSKALCCKEVAIVCLSKLTETPPNLGCTRFLFIVAKFLSKVRKLGTGKRSEVRFVAAFRFAGVSDLTGTTTEPDSPGI
jgi:hypothetical protein